MKHSFLAYAKQNIGWSFKGDLTISLNHQENSSAIWNISLLWSKIWYLGKKKKKDLVQMSGTVTC